MHSLSFADHPREHRSILRSDQGDCSAGLNGRRESKLFGSSEVGGLGNMSVESELPMFEMSFTLCCRSRTANPPRRRAPSFLHVAAEFTSCCWCVTEEDWHPLPSEWMIGRRRTSQTRLRYRLWSFIVRGKPDSYPLSGRARLASNR